MESKLCFVACGGNSSVFGKPAAYDENMKETLCNPQQLHSVICSIFLILVVDFE